MQKPTIFVDHLLQEELSRFGYTITGWSKWAKQAQIMYEEEVQSGEERWALVLSEQATPQEIQLRYNDWLIANKDRITEACLKLYS